MTNQEAMAFMSQYRTVLANGSKRYKPKQLKNDPRYGECLELVNEIDHDFTPAELYWCLKYNYNQEPICRTCRKKIQFKIEKIYKVPPDSYVRKYCSRKCFNADPVIREAASAREKSKSKMRFENRKKTIIKKYGSWENRPGVNNFKDANQRLKTDEKAAIKKAARTKTTNLKKYGVEHLMKKPEVVLDRLRSRTNTLVGCGVVNPSQLHYNIKNFNRLSPEFIKSNFISSSGYFKTTCFQKFLGCSVNTSFKIMREYDISYKYRPNGFNPDKPATLYYILDQETGMYKIGITNKTVKERFGQLCSTRAIALMEQSYDNGQDAYLAEQEILQAFKAWRCTNDNWPETLGGKTEFFTRDILELDKKDNK